MKKTLLAVAVAALSANAFAVDLDDNSGVQFYAQEITVAATGTTLAGATADVTAGFALATDGYVRFDLANGATFDGVPALDTTGASAYSVSAGGDGANYVIFRTDGSGVAINEVLTLTGDVSVTGKTAVGLTYNLYETAANAVAKSGSLATRTGTLLNFRSALSVTATEAAGILNIDAISSESKQFVGPAAVTDLTDLSVTVVPATLTPAGVAVAAIGDIASAYSWTLNGNFSAEAGIADAGATAFTVAADKQSATLANAANGTVTYTVTTTDEIAETVVSAVFSATPVAGYTISNVTVANAAELEKNGTTVDVDLALKPGGVFSNYVRISNKDTIPGAFSIRVIADDGQSASFPLSAVAGQPATLAAGASTTQMSIQQVFDAAQAAGLALSGEGKLRLEVTGQVNDLDVQTYTVATDGTTFSTF